MSEVSEFFVTDHRQAVAYAAALEAGKPAAAAFDRLPAPAVTDLDVEILGELAARTVHAGGVDCTLGMVDVALDSLFVLPEPLTVVLAELKDLEDQEEVSDLAEQWAQTEEMSSTAAVTEPLLRSLAELASQVDEDGMVNLYFRSA
jgi:hypothetical protein